MFYKLNEIEVSFKLIQETLGSQEPGFDDAQDGLARKKYNGHLSHGWDQTKNTFPGNFNYEADVKTSKCQREALESYSS